MLVVCGVSSWRAPVLSVGWGDLVEGSMFVVCGVSSWRAPGLSVNWGARGRALRSQLNLIYIINQISLYRYVS